MGKLRQPTKAILSYELGFEALLVLFGSLGRRWLGVLGELASEHATNVARCISLFRKITSQDMMKPLFFVAQYVKRRHSELFAREFVSQLSESWSSTGLLLILSLFGTDDTVLLSPLHDYLAKLKSANASPELLASQQQLVAALQSAIRKIEGKAERKWWQFWKR
jgi:hypothetical protein